MKLIMGHCENHISSSVITPRICFQFSSIVSDQLNRLLAQQLMNFIIENNIFFFSEQKVNVAVWSSAVVFACVRNKWSISISLLFTVSIYLQPAQAMGTPENNNHLQRKKCLKSSSTQHVFTNHSHRVIMVHGLTIIQCFSTLPFHSELQPPQNDMIHTALC